MRFSSISLAVSVLLVACGGGGNDAPAIPAVPVAATPLVLTPANYSSAAQESVSSTLYVVNSASLATGSETSTDSTLMNHATTFVQHAANWFGTAPTLASGAVTTATQACPGGGSMTLSANDANGNNLVDVGDSVSITTNNCKVNADTLSGGISIVFTALSGNVNTNFYTASAAVTFSALKATTAAGSTTGNGTLSVHITSLGTNNSTVLIATNSFSSSATYGGVSATRTLTNFNSTGTVTPSPLTSSVSTSGTVASSALEGKTLSLATVTPFVRTGSNLYPSSGQAIITGANGGKIRFTALNGTSVQIELDADANGTYEATVTRAWSQLL